MDRVTITGADDGTPIPALVDLSKCKDLITREAYTCI
jgi:hypothetical protein